MPKRAKKSTNQVGVSEEGDSPFNGHRKSQRPRHKRKKAPKLQTGDTTKVGGRPPFVPTVQDTAMATALAGVGYSQEQIAAHFGISVNTLMKHFGDTIRTAAGTLLANGYGAIARALSKSDTAAVQAGKFVLSTKGKQYGWTERVEHTGPDGADIFAGLDLTKLSEARFNQLRDLLSLAGAAI